MNRALPATTQAYDTQRLDKWLWFARVVRTRTLAAGLVTSGKVRVNRQRVEKPGYAVRCGDVVTVAAGARIRVLRITAPGLRRGSPADAATLYEEVSTVPPGAAGGQPAQPRPTEPGDSSGPPTKRQRRLARQLTGKG